MQKSRVQYLTASAMMVAITAVCAQIILPLPFTPVFFTLAILAVLLTGAVLPPRWALGAMLCYLLLGFFGAPIFGGFKGGPGVLLGPTGGYLMAYPLMAWLIAWICSKGKKGLWLYIAAMMAAMVVCYILGTAWYCILTGTGLWAALMACVFPFVIPDLLKIAAASLCAVALQKANR